MATVLTGCCSTFVEAQTATAIPANLAASHIGEYATVEGVVAKVFTSKSGNTFLNIGASYPNPLSVTLLCTHASLSIGFAERRSQDLRPAKFTV